MEQAGGSSTPPEGAAGEQRQRMEAALQAAWPRPASPQEEVQRLAEQEQRQLEAREELALQAVRAHVTARKPQPQQQPPQVAPQSSSTAIQCCTVTRRGDQDIFTCKFPGCGREYTCRDAVRKHCRIHHLQWLRSIDPRQCVPMADNAATFSSDELTSEASREIASREIKSREILMHTRALAAEEGAAAVGRLWTEGEQRQQQQQAGPLDTTQVVELTITSIHAPPPEGAPLEGALLESDGVREANRERLLLAFVRNLQSKTAEADPPAEKVAQIA